MAARESGHTVGERFVAFLGAVLMLALIVMVDPTRAAADPATLSNQCSVDEWQTPANFTECVGKLHDLTTSELQCLSAPVPETPDSGLPGWFASEPSSSKEPGPTGKYSQYGYAGYDFTTYGQGCVSPLTHPASSFEDTIANGEFMIATSIIGAADALRQYAWDPQNMWGWADPLVDKATKSLYAKVFTVFGSLTLAVVGLYLLWRSRQSDMSNAVTTAGWAIFVMVIVTAIAAWPVRSAHLADATLVGGLGVVHNAIGPETASIPASKCLSDRPTDCVDHRSPAVRASDTATENMIYKNWLRGVLGSADSATALKYGPILYDAKSFTWAQEEQIRNHPNTRQILISDKQLEWMKVANQIKTEDPQAYSYLQGDQGMDRIGAGFIAILSSLFFGMFDITASILVLIGFLIFRWAVIAAPILGTIGLLRPASSGLRRLANAVLAAIFNIIIFGTGAAVYLFAVDLIMDTATLPGWLQVVLVWLVGVVGWLLLRPYRRITQMGGKDSTAAIVSGGTWHRRFLRDVRETARLEIAQPGGTAEPTFGRARPGDIGSGSIRPESRTEDVVMAGGDGRAAPTATETPSRPETGSKRRPPSDWTEPDVPEAPSNYAVYRPGSPSETPPVPQPARRPESTPVGG
jgi:hypothetical protein